MTRFYFNKTDCRRFTDTNPSSDALFTREFLEWAKDYDIRFYSKDPSSNRIIEMHIGQVSHKDFWISDIPSDSILIPDEGTAILFKLTWL